MWVAQGNYLRKGQEKLIFKPILICFKDSYNPDLDKQKLSVAFTCIQPHESINPKELFNNNENKIENLCKFF